MGIYIEKFESTNNDDTEWYRDINFNSQNKYYNLLEFKIILVTYLNIISIEQYKKKKKKLKFLTDMYCRDLIVDFLYVH